MLDHRGNLNRAGLLESQEMFEPLLDLGRRNRADWGSRVPVSIPKDTSHGEVVIAPIQPLVVHSEVAASVGPTPPLLPLSRTIDVDRRRLIDMNDSRTLVRSRSRRRISDLQRPKRGTT